MKKKILIILAVLAICFSTAGCKNNKENIEPKSNNEVITENNNVEVKIDNKEEEQKNGEAINAEKAISYSVNGEDVIFKIKTSCDIKKDSGWLGICPVGIYLTESQADDADVYYERFDSSFEKDWFEGIYTFVYHLDQIEDGIYTIVLCDNDDDGNLVGEWLFSKNGNNVSLNFEDAFLKGANESRNAEEFGTLGDEVKSWFKFDYDDEWLNVDFDGFYLENKTSNEPYVYVFPFEDASFLRGDEGEYIEKGEFVDKATTNAGLYSKCPYRFALENYSISNGTYTFALTDDEGKIICIFSGTKSDDKWTFDFSKAESPMLEEKYAETVENN